ncbi:MAG: N-acetyltransferase [Alphaproteobacteria bacterium]|nr:N-acetyltransferase [Alphaproteobacteria bacterium]
MRYSEQRYSRHTLASSTRYVRSFAGTPNYLWAIEATSPLRGHIGNVNVYVEKRNRVAEVGLLIGDRSMWGQGLGREAWTAACDFLLNTAHLRKVTASTLSENLGMIGIMRATGMSDDGRRVRHVLVDGAEVDLVHAALFRDALRKTRNGP